MTAGFKGHIVCRLGNMRKEVQWILYPQDKSKPNELLIQCDKRMARIYLDTAKADLSSGKGGHNGFMSLTKMMGAVEVDVPADVITRLKQLLAGNDQNIPGLASVSVKSL